MAHLYTLTGAVRSTRLLRPSGAMGSCAPKTFYVTSCRIEFSAENPPRCEVFMFIILPKGEEEIRRSTIAASKSSNAVMAGVPWPPPLTEAVKSSRTSGTASRTITQKREASCILKSFFPRTHRRAFPTAPLSGTVWRKSRKTATPSLPAKSKLLCQTRSTGSHKSGLSENTYKTFLFQRECARITPFTIKVTGTRTRISCSLSAR